MATLPALPSQAFAGVSLSNALLSRAEHMTGLWVHTSATMMKNAFGLDDHTAQALFQKLRDKNVISAPNKMGVARAVLPYYDNPVFAAKVQRLLTKAASNPSLSPKESHQEFEQVAQKLKQNVERHIATPKPKVTNEGPE